MTCKNPILGYSKHSCATVAAIITSSLAIPAFGQVLTSESFTISSGAAKSGGGLTSDMIFSDGTSWSGGAVGLQGSAGVNNLGTSTAAANVTFKYGVGSTVDALNTAYGAGNWTIENAELTLQYTLYAGNSRFNAGAGTFNILWVANDNWTQGSSDPAFATSASALAAWAGSDALLASEYYNWSTPSYTGTLADLHTANWNTDATGSRQATISYSLGLDSSFINDITSATGASDPNVSLYLMASTNTLGMCIFTGGGSVLPTLSFDVVAVPEPSVPMLTAGALAGMLTLRRFKA